MHKFFSQPRLFSGLHFNIWYDFALESIKVSAGSTCEELLSGDRKNFQRLCHRHQAERSQVFLL